MALTQAGAFGAHSGRRYGSFAGKASSSSGHPVGVITQPGAFGAHSGARYGSFAGKSLGGGSAHPVGLLTQALAFGAGSGRRYGSFAGRTATIVPPTILPQFSYDDDYSPREHVDREAIKRRARQRAEDDMMLHIIMQAVTRGTL